MYGKKTGIYEVNPFGGERIIPTYSEYETEMSIFGTKRTVYQITSYLEVLESN